MSASQPLQTIVVATDFSETAGAALGWAAEIAREHRARLVLVHATMPSAPAAPEFVVLPPSYYDEVRHAAQDQLDALVAALQPTGVPCSSEVLVAPTATAILDAAAQLGADLIVAGTRGRTGWKRIVLGSIAARLVRDAPCPVLTVHPSDARHPRPVRSVLVATDFSEQAWLAAEAASRIVLTAPEASRIVLLHVYRVPIESSSPSPRQLTDAIHEAAESARGRLVALAGRLARPGLRVDVEVREGHPAEVIVDQATRLGVDLVALGTHGRSALGRVWIGSTAERVLPLAPCPVLTLRGET